MQAFLPLLLSAKMLECRVIRTENWTILLNKVEGKFITLLGKGLKTRLHMSEHILAYLQFNFCFQCCVYTNPAERGYLCRSWAIYAATAVRSNSNIMNYKIINIKNENQSGICDDIRSEFENHCNRELNLHSFIYLILIFNQRK